MDQQILFNKSKINDVSAKDLFVFSQRYSKRILFRNLILIIIMKTSAYSYLIGKDKKSIIEDLGLEFNYYHSEI